MEVCYPAELFPLTSPVHTQGSPSSSACPSTRQTKRKYLPVNGAFLDRHVKGFSSSTLVHSKQLPTAALDCHGSYSSTSSSSASSSSSSTQQATGKHLLIRAISDNQLRRSPSSPTQHVTSAISDCQGHLFSSSSTQHVKRKRLPRTIAHCSQILEFPTSPSIQHVRGQRLLRAFSDFHASYSSPSSATLPRGSVYFRTQGILSLSTQKLRRMYPPRAFLNHHQCHGFIFAEQQQFPTLIVRTRASVGRLSGSIHGSNSRRGQHRKWSDIAQEGNMHHGKEIVDEPVAEDADCHMFCDDVSYDNDSEYDIHCENVPSINKNYAGSLLSSTCLYDSIHGDFWLLDPYYQEFENENAQWGRVLYGSAPERSDNISAVSGKSLIEIVDVRGSQSDEHLKVVQGENGVAYESMDRSNSRSVFSVTATEDSSSPLTNVCKSIKEPFPFNLVEESTARDCVDALERDQHHGLDPEKCLSEQNETGIDMVRDVRCGERPSASLGSLQNIEGTYLDCRLCSGNSDVDATNLESRSFTQTGVVGTVGDLSASNVGASINNTKFAAEKSGYLVTECTALPNSQSPPVVKQVGQVVEQMAVFLPDSVKEKVVNAVEKLPVQVSQVAEQVILKVVDQLPDPVVEQGTQVAEQVTQTAEQIVEQVASQVVEPISSTASQIENFLSSDGDDMESDNEFEAYKSLDIPEFKGHLGLRNFTILQEEQGIISIIYDFYIFMLKRSFFEFMLGMFAAPIFLSMIFTILYLPEFSGLAFDETIRESLQNSEAVAKGAVPGLQLSWETIFQVFMFSVSLSTGLQPELAPMSPYTLVVANLNALFAQLIFVFLSGAVFARLSQPSQPVKCSTVAIICPPPNNRRLRKEACHKALLTRYVLVGPQPCELVDVKVDLTYNYNTITRSGTYFRTSQSLKLVRPEISFLTNGMMVRHIIDETSPLYQRTRGMLEQEDAVFSLSVVGLERSSMQSVFHVQHYCVHDKDVVWDAEFVDMILISKRNRRVVDHSLLSRWRTVIPS